MIAHHGRPHVKMKINYFFINHTQKLIFEYNIYRVNYSNRFQLIQVDVKISIKNKCLPYLVDYCVKLSRPDKKLNIFSILDDKM